MESTLPSLNTPWGRAMEPKLPQRRHCASRDSYSRRDYLRSTSPLQSSAPVGRSVSRLGRGLGRKYNPPPHLKGHTWGRPPAPPQELMMMSRSLERHRELIERMDRGYNEFNPITGEFNPEKVRKFLPERKHFGAKQGVSSFTREEKPRPSSCAPSVRHAFSRLEGLTSTKKEGSVSDQFKHRFGYRPMLEEKVEHRSGKAGLPALHRPGTSYEVHPSWWHQ